MLICPDCNETVRVGFGGEKNLAIHRTSKACQSRRGNKNKGPKRPSERPPKPDQPNHDLRAFFTPRVSLNPPTVAAPPPIHADEMSFRRSDNMGLEEPPVEVGARLGVRLPIKAATVQGRTPCQKGIELLNKLKVAMTQIPDNVPLATPAHWLNIFSADLHSCVARLEQGSEVDFEDDWMLLNSMLKTAFGWGESEMRENMKGMLNRGEHGLDGFVQFFKYFVLQQGLEGTMIETKIDGLLCEIVNQ